MKISCFFEPWVTRDAALVELWCRVWKEHGWEPVVLSLSDAIVHPRYAELSARIYRYPSVNDWRFESLCYLRWCAYALAGGAIADYDVFPRAPFPPRSWSVYTNGSPVLDTGFIVGTCADHERFLSRIIDHIPHSTHVSDMSILKDNADIFKTEPLVQVYGHDRWRDYPLTHFANGSMHAAKADLVSAVLHL